MGDEPRRPVELLVRRLVGAPEGFLWQRRHRISSPAGSTVHTWMLPIKETERNTGSGALDSKDHALRLLQHRQSQPVSSVFVGDVRNVSSPCCVLCSQTWKSPSSLRTPPSVVGRKHAVGKTLWVSDERLVEMPYKQITQLPDNV